MADLFTKNLSNVTLELITSRYTHLDCDLKKSLSIFQSHRIKASHTIEDGCYKKSNKNIGE